MGEKIRKVFLEDLPRQNGYGGKRIDWGSCIGYKVKFIYDDIEGEVLINKVEGVFITIEYNNISIVIRRGEFRRCEIGKILNRYSSAFKYEIGEVINDFVITYKRRIDGFKCYKFQCLKCGFDCGYNFVKGCFRQEYWVQESKLELGQNCPCCCNSPQLIIPHVNSIVAKEETHWMIPYFQGGYDEAKKYAPQSNVKLHFKCPYCGELKMNKIKVSALYNNKKTSCACGDGFSYPEKFMYSILKQLDVKFETQYSPKYLKLNGSQKRSDFYIPSLRLVIETDGRFGHKGGITHNNSYQPLEELVSIDNWKDEQHLKHGIKTIRINCFKSDIEYIRNNILQSELVNYFDFDNINWDKADEFAWFSNLRKEVCDYWNNKEEWETTKDLAKVFDISNVSIRNYIKKGTELKWCNYSPKIGISKTKSKVEVSKERFILGIFESCMEIERESEELFGVKLLHTAISDVCNGKRKLYKGYQFKYVD